MSYRKIFLLLLLLVIAEWANKAITASSSQKKFAVAPAAETPAAPAAGGEVPLCKGDATPDVPVEVTKRMSMVGPNVVAVYQLTGADSKGEAITTYGGAVIHNYLTNSDMAVYTGRTNPPVFIVNAETGQGVKVKTIRIDHRGQQIASKLGGNHLRVSVDGLAITQAWKNTTGVDMMFTSLAGPGSCATKYITHLNLPPATGGATSGIATTNPSWDAAKNLYHVCFAPGGGNSRDPGKIYCAYSDGSASSFQAAEPKDNCQGFVYHKSRMNYRFPYLLAMQRANAAGAQSRVCNDLIDLKTGTVVADLGDGRDLRAYYNHDDWSPDGLSLLAEAPRSTGGMIYTTVLDPSGNVLKGFDLPRSTSNPNGYVNINVKHRVQAEWCSFGPGKVALCTSRIGTGGPGFPVEVPANCHPAFSIDLNNPDAPNALKFITCTDGWSTRYYEGQPVIRYAYTDASGNVHALFRSDKSGYPQVYEVVYKP